MALCPLNRLNIMHLHRTECRDLHYYDIVVETTGNPDVDARNVYLGAWVSLLGDSPCGFKPRSSVGYFYHLLRNNFDNVCKEYANLAHHLMTSIVWRDGVLVSNVDVMLFLTTPVFKEVVIFSRLKRADVLRYLLTFLLFGKRTPQQDLSTFQEVSLEKWLATEDRISKVDLDSLAFVDDLRKVIQWAVAPRYKHTFLPKHGSGAAAGVEGTALSDKHKALTYDSRVNQVFFGGLATISPKQVLPDSSEWSRVPIAKENRTSELVLVPKDIFQARSICKEPVPLQYAQQSVRIALERAIARGPFGTSTRLADQSWNREAAREGSISSHVDTIDLSEASDSVLVDLVRRIFPRAILKHLLATRSTKVRLPTGDNFVPLKFAPMGSAVCFPVQCVVYSAVCFVAMHQIFHPGVQVSRKSLTRLMSSINTTPQLEASGIHCVRVYGDDIICDARVTPRVIDMLTQLGFKVNTSKSFMGAHAFRESCGGFYLSGADVTPLTMKLKDFSPKSMSPRVFQGLSEAANRAYSYGYTGLREFLLRYLTFAYTKKPRHLWYASCDGALHGPIPEFAPAPITRGPGVSNNGSYIQPSVGEVVLTTADALSSPYLYAVNKSRDNPSGLRAYTHDDRPTPILPLREKQGGRSRRTCDLYQRDEQYVMSVTTRSKDDGHDDNYAYNLWMRSPGTTEEVVKPPWVPRDQELKFHYTWKPA